MQVATARPIDATLGWGFIEIESAGSDTFAPVCAAERAASR